MKACITGATGFIGTRLLDELAGRGERIRVLVHKRKPGRTGGFETVAGDVGDIPSLEAAFSGMDLVFHLAAALGSALIDETAFLRINAQGAENVMTAARKAGVSRVIHFSSAGVLGHVESGSAADEDTPPHPQNAYDRSKLEGERAVLRVKSHGPEVVILRPGWVYGPGDRRTFKLIRAIARRRFLLVSRGDARQTPVYIDDLIRGVIQCAGHGGNGQIYHLAGDQLLSVRDIVEEIAAATGTRIPGLRLPVAPLRLTAALLDKAFRLFHREAPLTPGKLAFFIHPKPLAIDKARAEVGYSPRIDFRSGMEKTCAWYRSQGWL